MFTKNIKDSFTANLLNAVSGVLGEAKKKKCSEGCECEACEPEETKEGYMPTNDMPSAKDRKTAGKLGALLKRERDAKEKKEPNGVKTEEVEDLDEKRGLWDNIHAKRKRIKAGSGERMRKPGSEGAPTKADFKASANEAFEQIDEISKATMGRYINKAKDSIDMASYRQGHKEAHGSSSRPLEKKLSKRHKGIETAVKKLTKEDAEQIDELSKGTMGRYINKAATKMGSQGVTAGLKIAADEKSSKNFKDMGKREKGIKLAVSKLTKEDAEQVDEGSYKDNPRHMGTIGPITTDAERRERAKKYREKLTKEEQDFVDSLNDAGMEQIDELSNRTLGSYVKKAKKELSSSDYHVGRAVGARETGQKSNFSPELERKLAARGKKRYHGIDKAVDKMMTKEEQDFIDALNDADMDQIDEANYDVDHMPGQTMSASAADKQTKKVHDDWAAGAAARAKGRAEAAKRKLATEEVELDEARGRPKKAGARDFTIHPKTKEKLMHNNPADMARIERLQKNGILQKPKTEANQHVIQQLQRAKLSMRGGETINFTHGDPTHVSGTHASKLLDKYAGMKPDEKEAFQKKIGHSHAKLKSEL